MMTITQFAHHINILKLLKVTEGDSEETIRSFSIKRMTVSGNFQAMLEVEEEGSKTSTAKI